MAKSRIDVISPDGISISREETYANMTEARKAFNKWKKGFEFQGYYGTVKGGQRVRIPLDQLENHVKFQLIK